MPVIAVVGAYIGTTVATAIGISTVVGAALGAGLLSGIYADSQGGSFGSGFAMGAIGGLVGASMGLATGGIEAGAAEGAATETLAQEVGGISSPTALEGITPTTPTAGLTDTAAMSEIGGYAGTPTDLASITQNAGQFSATQPQELGSLFGEEIGGISGGYTPIQTDLSSIINQAPQTSYGASPDTTSLSETPTYSPYDTGGAGGLTSGNIENTGIQNQTTTPNLEGVQQPAGNVYDTEIGYNEAGRNTGGLKGMFNSTNDWMNENLGFGLEKGYKGLGSLYDIYEGQKRAGNIEDETNRIRQQYAPYLNPMSREEYIRANVNPNDYLRASQQMARAGRTGTLPVLLANMKYQAGQNYANKYLPQASQSAFNASLALANRQAAAQAAKDQSLDRGIGSLGQLFFS